MKKKIGAGPTTKSGAGIASGSSSNVKTISYTTTSKKTNLGSTSSVPKSPLPSTSSAKSNTTSSYNATKSNKSSATFGFIWIPTRKNKKDKVWNPHGGDKYKEKDRSPSIYKFMSGDSEPNKKKEDADHLMSEKTKGLAPINVSTTVAAADASMNTMIMDKLEDKQGFMRHETEDSKAAAGDMKKHNSNKQSSDSDEIMDNTSKMKIESDKGFGDTVDFVYPKPTPLKTQSVDSTENDCGLNCLYYTLQCCDCVIM